MLPSRFGACFASCSSANGAKVPSSSGTLTRIRLASPATTRLPALLAIVFLLLGTRAAALGVGELRTQSALNQPFYGEIALFDVSAETLDNVKASLASRSAFAQAGIERPHFLTRLRFTPMVGPQGEPIIQVVTREPIREPFLDILVEVAWPDGRLLKGYAVLLDPPAVGGNRNTWVDRPLPTPQRPTPRERRSPFVEAAEAEERLELAVGGRVLGTRREQQERPHPRTVAATSGTARTCQEQVSC